MSDSVMSELVNMGFDFDVESNDDECETCDN